MNAARAALLALLGAAGCAGLSPFPDTRSPADRAHELDARCGAAAGADADADAMLGREHIDAVKPYYVTLPAGNGHENRMLGARVLLRPAPGWTRELIARALQCHEARVVLGASPPVVDDPYFLPDSWLTIDVESEDTGFAVLVYPVNFRSGDLVLARARRYASGAPAQ